MKFSNLSTLLLGLTAATFVVVSAKNGGKHQHDYFEDDLDETSHQNHNQQPPPQKMCDRDGAIQAQMGLLFGACDVKDAISQIQSIFTNGFAYNMMTQEAGTDAKPYFDEIFNVVCKKKACYESLDQNMYAIQHNVRKMRLGRIEEEKEEES